MGTHILVGGQVLFLLFSTLSRYSGKMVDGHGLNSPHFCLCFS